MCKVDTEHYTSTYHFLCKPVKLWRKLFFWELDAPTVNFYHLYRLKTKGAGKESMIYLQFKRKLVAFF
jgi:hypothetical protein